MAPLYSLNQLNSLFEKERPNFNRSMAYFVDTKGAMVLRFYSDVIIFRNSVCRFSKIGNTPVLQARYKFILPNFPLGIVYFLLFGNV